MGTVRGVGREVGVQQVAYLPELDPVTGLLPVGRFPLTLDEVCAQYVQDSVFSGSVTRGELWTEWENHRCSVEAAVGSLGRVWLGGSFVSGKLDPQDIDVVYLLPAQDYDRLEPEDRGFLMDLCDKEWCHRTGMRIDAYGVRLPDEIPFWQLAGGYSQKAGNSFRDIGIFDEIWQRTRCEDSDASPLRRGYVEVLL